VLDRTSQLHRAAPPAQREPAPAGHTEFAICDQTIDEHRIGLKPILRKVWTPPNVSGQRPQRPSAPVEQRYDWRYLVGFVHPASGRTVWHLATTVNIELFSVELEAFAQEVSAGPTKQIVLVLDRAGWHDSPKVRMPEHVHLLFLPPHAPELQLAEHLWPLSNTVLANRHFVTIDELEDAPSPVLCQPPSTPRPHPLHHPLPVVAPADQETPRTEVELVSEIV
jgi:hypothetical protein